MIDVDKFWRDGFLVLPGFFDPEEVARWRQRAVERGRTLADLLTDATLGKIVYDSRLVAAARDILGADPVYFGDSNTAIGYNGWGFHKDNSDRLDPAAPDWQTDRYPLIRFGIYAQSHDPEPGGLELRRGSHMIPDYVSGEYLSPAVRPGDVIVWNFRTSHSAGVRKVKLLGSKLPHNKWTGRLDRRLGLQWLMQKPRAERVAMFVTYASQHPLLDRHIEYLKQRAYPWDMWRESHWSDEARRRAEAAGLSLIDPTGFQYEGQRLYVEHHQLPG